MKKRIFSFIIVFLVFFLYIGNLFIFATNDNVTITFNNKNLYNAIINQLSEKYIYSKDDTSNSINIKTDEIVKIKRLELDGKDLSDLSGIDKFTSLEELILNNNKVSNLDCLLGLNNLNYLDLAHNCITNIDSINTLTNLKHLDLYDNIVRDLTGLANMTSLEYLNLGDNNETNVSTFTKLDNLKTIPNLKYLNFSRNNTPEIMNNLDNMLNVEFINLQGNNISNISNLSTLTNLKELYLNSNSISDITTISGLSNLETLYLNNNSIATLESLFNNGELIQKKLHKLHIYNLKNLNKNSDELNILKNLSKSKQIELGYEIIYNSVEPHTDSNGIKYITYDDFGARCDGIYDDMIAIKDAHRYASSKGYEVRATAGKTYHIYNYYTGTTGIYTNTDWQNATFIIHDENIEDISGRYDNIFSCTSNYSGITTLENPNITINKSIKKITGIEDTLNILNSKGYKKYMLMAENANKKICIRFGSNSNPGDNQVDCFEIDSDGNILNDIQWDFETVTKLTIYPISDKKLTIKNGNFITNAFNGKHDVPYSRGYGKPLYYQRGFFFWAASNLDLTNIHHTLSEDRISGSYYQFLCFRYCSDVNIKDSSFYAREFGVRSRSTYDLKIEQCVNFYFDNVSSNGLHDSNRWGVMATAYCKDFVFNNVSLNRIDAHQIIYNLTVTDSYLGYHSFTLTGQGTLNIENTTVESEYFINLRSDYGSTWNGNVYISNCIHKHQSNYMHKFINFSIGLENDGKLHDFGYEVHQPNIFIENFTVDCINKKDIKNYPIIANFKDHNFEKAKDDYWSKIIYINGYKIINNTNSAPYIALLATASDKINNNYLITDTKLTVGTENYTHQFNINSPLKTDKNVTLQITPNISASNSLTITNDDVKIVDTKAITENYTHNFTENGTYLIKINSTDTHLNKTGEKTYSFEISKEVTSETPVDNNTNNNSSDSENTNNDDNEDSDNNSDNNSSNNNSEQNMENNSTNNSNNNSQPANNEESSKEYSTNKYPEKTNTNAINKNTTDDMNNQTPSTNNTIENTNSPINQKNKKDSYNNTNTLSNSKIPKSGTNIIIYIAISFGVILFVVAIIKYRH